MYSEWQPTLIRKSSCKLVWTILIMQRRLVFFKWHVDFLFRCGVRKTISPWKRNLPVVILTLITSKGNVSALIPRLLCNRFSTCYLLNVFQVWLKFMSKLSYLQMAPEVPKCTFDTSIKFHWSLGTTYSIRINFCSLILSWPSYQGTRLRLIKGSTSLIPSAVHKNVNKNKISSYIYYR